MNNYSIPTKSRSLSENPVLIKQSSIQLMEILQFRSGSIQDDNPCVILSERSESKNLPQTTYW